jgi:hypothetical protein
MSEAIEDMIARLQEMDNSECYYRMLESQIIQASHVFPLWSATQRRILLIIL